MKKGLAFLFTVCVVLTYGQDIHFTQTAQTPLLINPAAAGVFDGWERVIINHRNQWLGANTQFMTSSIAADVNLFKKEQNDKAHLGVGILFYNDIGGDSDFGHRSGALTLSGILPMGRSGHILSAGIQGGWNNRSGNTNKVRFHSQWNGSEYDQLILSGEQNKLAGFNYIDANAGIYYVYDGSQTTFARNKKFNIKAGFSGYHLNEPELKFSNGIKGERLHRKFIGHVGITSEIGTSKFTIDANAVQAFQGSHRETLLGMLLRYRFENGTMVTGLSQDAFIGVGLYTRITDAIMPTVMIDWKGFQFGVSYDVILSEMRRAYGGGSLEFSLSYTNRNHAIFKTRGRRF